MKVTQTIKVTLAELKQMCEKDPGNISIAKKSALDRAAQEFNLGSASEIKKFIVDGLENETECPSSESDLFPGVVITAYKFRTGSLNGYLAFHQAIGRANGIHVKSLHLDDTNKSLGTLGDLFKDVVGGKND